MMQRLARAVAFARHVPPAQLLWRVRLTLARRLAVRRPPSLGGATPPLAAVPPQPVFPPRTGMIAQAADGWAMTFVGRTVAVGDPIDWTRPSAGAADQLWRMNLHYFEYLEELDAATGRALIREWIPANPPFAPGSFGDAWNSYALSLRVLCWMQFLARTGISADDGAILDSLARQIRFLMRNLERDLGGNHLMKNIKALAWAGAFFAGDEARGWQAAARRLLARELDVQLLDDGVHYERSPSYHAQVLADLIETRVALGSDPGLDAAIAAMTQAAVDLAHPDGRAAVLNDAGLHMAYPPAECAAAAGIAAEPRRVFAYPQAGFYGAHLAGLSIVADLGRVGADSLPAHAHGDIGTFELSVDGRRVVVDQGVFEYVAGPRRDLSRAAHAHASLAIEGAEQADFFGAFRCGRRPDAGVTRWEPHVDGFVLEGWHDGYAAIAGKAWRRFTVDAQGVRIDDRIDRAVDRTVSLGLLLHPDVVPSIEGEGATLQIGDARLIVTANGPLAIEEAVWWPDMGVEVPTRRLRLTWPVRSVEGRLEIRRQAGEQIGA